MVGRQADTTLNSMLLHYATQHLQTLCTTRVSIVTVIQFHRCTTNERLSTHCGLVRGGGRGTAVLHRQQVTGCWWKQVAGDRRSGGGRMRSTGMMQVAGRRFFTVVYQ